MIKIYLKSIESSITGNVYTYRGFRTCINAINIWRSMCRKFKHDCFQIFLFKNPFYLYGPMQFYLGPIIILITRNLVGLVLKTNNRDAALDNCTLYNERVESVRWQKHQFHTLDCYWVRNGVRINLKIFSFQNEL